MGAFVQRSQQVDVRVGDPRTQKALLCAEAEGACLLMPGGFERVGRDLVRVLWCPVSQAGAPGVAL